MPVPEVVSRADADANSGGIIAPFLSSRPFLRDALLALAFLGVWSLGLVIALRLSWHPLNLDDYVTVGLIGALALLLCRRFPLLGLILVGVLTAWPYWWFDVPELRVVPLIVGGYLATSHGLRLIIAGPLTAVFTLFTLVPLTDWMIYRPANPDWLFENLRYQDPSTRILSAVVVISALLLGSSARAQRAAVEKLLQRNGELQRLRKADIARIASEERTAIAREIHDVVAHHVSAMVIRAQAADRVADSRPEEVRAAVRWIAASGKDALTAMRQVVRVLRADGGAPLAPPPTSFLPSLQEVISRVRETGLAVETFIAVGVPLSTLQEAAILRIAQEAMTNVMLHSNATLVRIRLGVQDDTIALRVDDDGRQGENSRSFGSSETRPGGGTGVRGMRERAEFVGGTLTAGRIDGQGWRVEAVLPLDNEEAGTP